MAEITREQLTDALREFRLTVRDEFGQATHGVVMMPEQAASALLSQLSANAAHEDDEARETTDGHRCCWHLSLNPEMRRMAEISASLEALDGAGNCGRASVRRVLSYLASRYGYVLDTED